MQYRWRVCGLAPVLLGFLALTCAACSAPSAGRDTPGTEVGTASDSESPGNAAIDRPIMVHHAYPGLDLNRIIDTRVWTAHPTDDPTSDRRLTRTSQRLLGNDGTVTLTVVLDDTDTAESSTLRLQSIDGTARLQRMVTSDSVLHFDPALEVWPRAIAPGETTTSTTAVTGTRGARNPDAVAGSVTHTLSDRTDDTDRIAGLRRVESVFAFDLGMAKVTRSSTRWFAMPRSGDEQPRLVRETRERRVQAWILPARVTRSDWTANED